MTTLSKSLARAWLGTVGANALILFGGVGTGILAARLLGADDRGLLAAIMFWPGLLAGIGFLSLGEAVVFRVNNTALDRRRLTATVALLCFLLSFVVMAIGFFLMPMLLGPERSAVTPLATIYFLAYIPINFMASSLLILDHAGRRFRRYNLFRLLPSWTYLIGILALWAFNVVSFQTLLWASWLGSALTMGTYVWARRRDLIARPAWREMSAILRQGSIFHATTLIAMLSGQIDRIVVVRFFPDSEIGHYVVALTIATSGLGLVTSSVHTVLFPTLAAEPDRERNIAMLRDGLRRSTLFLIVSSGIAIPLIPFFLPVLFGSDFRPATPVAMLLVLAFGPLALRQIIIQCLRAFGEARIGVIAEAIAIGVFVVAVIPAIGLFGNLLGVGVAIGIANVAALMVASHALWRYHGLATAEWLLPSRAMIADVFLIVTRISSLRTPP